MTAVLAIDTCLAACSAALLREDGAVFARQERLGTGHAERIAPLVAALLGEAGLSPAALSKIGATVGPGSFMGSRVGISLAKGLALPRALPTVGVTTLRAIALSGGEGEVCVLIDARRGHAYAQAFGWGEGESEAALVSYEAASAMAARARTVLGVGLDAVLGPGAPSDLFPDPEILVRHVASAEPGALTPLYLRAPDAKPPSRAPL